MKTISGILPKALMMTACLLFFLACGVRQSEQKLSESRKYAPVSKDEMRQEDVKMKTADDGVAQNFNTEEYNKINENQFKDAKQNPLSTFSIDVDNASYTNVRRYINSSQLPPVDAVRIEELINYFTYDYPQPKGEHPFSITTEVSECTWNNQNKIVLIGLQGKKLNYEELHPCNFTFLIDCSGSMEDVNKLPLLIKSLKLMVKELSNKDKIAIVAYAGAAGLILPSTPASEKDKIIDALDKLKAGGSTAGGEGILLAYKVAKENLIPDGNNRVILCTDGDFNIGVSSTSELVRTIEEKRKDDIYLTICGFGMGNYKDGRMESIADAGNGNYFYIDNINEAQKVFVKEMRANMFTIAKDVKIQIEFNPNIVKAYRLIGYENRVLANEDFNNDKKDAGELGAGHRVTALYEIIPAGSTQTVPNTDDLKYQTITTNPNASNSEILTIKFRYKPPKSETSKLIEQVVKNEIVSLDKASENLRFALSVASYGMLLRKSEFKGDLTYEKALDLAEKAKGKDEDGYRTEFISLIKTTALLSK
jgi:Ca-activated chloride channel homolog